MNFLLWRSEYGWRNHVGAKVPVSVVWQKILTAPDNCGLQILHHGKEMGRCQWSANIGQELTAGKMLTDDVPLDGPRKNPPATASSPRAISPSSTGPTRLGFTIDITFTTNRDWQEFSASFKLRPEETWHSPFPGFRANPALPHGRRG